MLSTNFECVYTDMDFGWSGIHFSDESRSDGRYRVELVDAIAQWRDMHPDRIIRQVQFMDMSIAPRGGTFSGTSATNEPSVRKQSLAFLTRCASIALNET